MHSRTLIGEQATAHQHDGRDGQTRHARLGDSSWRLEAHCPSLVEREHPVLAQGAHAHVVLEGRSSPVDLGLHRRNPRQQDHPWGSVDHPGTTRIFPPQDRLDAHQTYGPAPGWSATTVQPARRRSSPPQGAAAFDRAEASQTRRNEGLNLRMAPDHAANARGTTPFDTYGRRPRLAQDVW